MKKEYIKLDVTTIFMIKLVIAIRKRLDEEK